MNPKISVLVFDLGNVLLPFDYNIVIERLESVEEGLGKRLMSKYKENYHLHRAHEKSELSSEKFIDTMLGWIDNKIKPEEFINIYSDVFEGNKELTALLPELKKKYKIVLLSNTNPIHQKQWEKYEFIKYIDHMVLSHEVKAFKPESEIYKAVEDYTKAKPEEHLFIDDIEEYVNAAIARGWQGVVMKNNKQLFKDFERFGIID